VLAQYPDFDFEKRRGTEMFEAFFQLQLRLKLMNALQPGKNEVIELESLAGIGRRNQKHLKNFAEFQKWRKERNENFKR